MVPVRDKDLWYHATYFLYLQTVLSFMATAAETEGGKIERRRKREGRGEEIGERESC
jgi:hypothetical protein